MRFTNNSAKPWLSSRLRILLSYEFALKYEDLSTIDLGLLSGIRLKLGLVGRNEYLHVYNL